MPQKNCSAERNQKRDPEITDYDHNTGVLRAPRASLRGLSGPPVPRLGREGDGS